MNADIAPYRVRLATAADVAVIARHRIDMFRDMGILPDGQREALEQGSVRFLERAIPARDYRGWLVEHDGGIVAGAGVVLRLLLPRAGHADGGTEAYVLNVYTDAEHRRRGLARALMHEIIAWCRREHIARITLHASDDGRALYTSLGFTPSTEMVWDVRD